MRIGQWPRGLFINRLSAHQSLNSMHRRQGAARPELVGLYFQSLQVMGVKVLGLPGAFPASASAVPFGGIAARNMSFCHRGRYKCRCLNKCGLAAPMQLLLSRRSRSTSTCWPCLRAASLMGVQGILGHSCGSLDLVRRPGASHTRRSSIHAKELT